jgi:hypothetical protein
MRAQFLARQKGRCAICTDPFHQYACAHALDHDHRTGKVRGLLCPSCNRRLGLYEAGRRGRTLYPGWIRQAQRYLMMAALRRD